MFIIYNTCLDEPLIKLRLIYQRKNCYLTFSQKHRAIFHEFPELTFIFNSMTIHKVHSFPRFCKQNIIRQYTVPLIVDRINKLDFNLQTNHTSLERTYTLKTSYVYKKRFQENEGGRQFL